jgi:hypothetical protein
MAIKYILAKFTEGETPLWAMVIDDNDLPSYRYIGNARRASRIAKRVSQVPPGELSEEMLGWIASSSYEVTTGWVESPGSFEDTVKFIESTWKWDPDEGEEPTAEDVAEAVEEAAGSEPEIAESVTEALADLPAAEVQEEAAPVAEESEGT